MKASDRLKWVDRAKVFAMLTVIYCHTPQARGSFAVEYWSTVILSVFVFISGYLRKDRGSYRNSLKKYWRGLVLPYIIYNVAFVPYSMLRMYIEHGGVAWQEVGRQLLGMVLLQEPTAVSEPLNGVTWYLSALLVIHLLADITEYVGKHRGCRQAMLLAVLLCAVSVAGYSLNKYSVFTHGLTTIGVMRCLPFFFMGWGIRRGTSPSLKESESSLMYLEIQRGSKFFTLHSSLFTLFLSMLLFLWHRSEQVFAVHIALYYVVCLLAVVGVTGICRYKQEGEDCRQVVRLSNGTLVLMGMHWMVLGGINFVFEQLTGREACYTFMEALAVVAVITAVLYPLIVVAERRMPWLIGRVRKVSR